MVELSVEKRMKQVEKTCNINQLFGEEYGQELYIDNRMGCRDGDTVCIDIGETRGDGVWEKEYRWRPVWAVVTFLPLIIWCGYRGNIGDTWAYKKSFSEMPVSLGGMASYMATVKKDKGFYFVSAVIKCIVGNHVNIYFIVLAAIQAEC